MTPGNVELVQIMVSWTTTLPAVVAIILRDERRLRGEMLERAWPPPSRDAAIFGSWNLGVHPLCLVLHFARTRRSLLGLGEGLLWLGVVIAVNAGAQLAVAAAIDWLHV